MKSLKKPYAMMPSGPIGWLSHYYTFQAIEEVFSINGYPVEKIWYPTPKLSAKYVAELKASASCLILPPIRDSEDLWFARKLRNEFGLKIPIIKISAGDFSSGGQAILYHLGMLNSNDHIVLNSNAELELAKKALPGFSNLHCIPCPVSEEIKTTLTQVQRRAFERKWGISSKNKILVYAGRITFQKNIHGLLYLFSKIVQKNKNSKLFILGDCDDVGVPQFGRNLVESYRNYLSKLVVKMGLENSVVFTGLLSRNEVASFFSLAAAQVSLTVNQTEDFGYSIAEGLMNGVPTVVTKWGGGLDHVRLNGVHGVGVQLTHSGYYVDYRQAEKSIHELLRSKPNRNEIAKDARDHYGIDCVVNKWRTIIDETDLAPQKGKIIPSELFARAFMERVLKQNKLLSKTHKEGFLILGKVFQSYKDPLVSEYFKAYSGNIERSDDDVCYLNPFSGLFNAIPVEPITGREGLKVSKAETRFLKSVFSAKLNKTIHWGEIKQNKMALKLSNRGVILIFKGSNA